MEFSGRAKKFIQYFWDPEPCNDALDPSEIWLLGRQYGTGRIPGIATRPQLGLSDKPLQEPSSDVEADLTAQTDSRGWPLSFVHDIGLLYAFTYRTNFPVINRSLGPVLRSESASLGMQIRLSLANNDVFTSDTGWGCMIRSGQCLIANAIARVWSSRGKSSTEAATRLISMFVDDARAPFSIHNFVVLGAEQCGKAVGEWFGPSATAQCIQSVQPAYIVKGMLNVFRTLCARHMGNELKVLVTEDGPNVYEDALLRLAEESAGDFSPVLILCGVRLGIDGITGSYHDAFKQCFQVSQTVGVAGGRPSASHYFVGLQGEHVFYLDPHDTRQAIPWQDDPNVYTSDDLNSYHTKRLRRVNIRELDPSMLIGFLIQNRADWHAWRASVEKQDGGRRIVHISDQGPQTSFTDQNAALGVESCDDDDDDADDNVRP